MEKRGLKAASLVSPSRPAGAETAGRFDAGFTEKQSLPFEWLGCGESDARDNAG
jgi:hypothetical protein